MFLFLSVSTKQGFDCVAYLVNGDITDPSSMYRETDLKKLKSCLLLVGLLNKMKEFL